jgi:hypothetical protein
MYQLEVVKFRDIIKLRNVTRFVPDQENHTIEVVGEDFRSAEEVYLNRIRVPNFVIVNKGTIWVTVPDGMEESLQEIEVVSSNFTFTAAASKVAFHIGDRQRKVTGILALLQLYTKWLMQDPGSDIFNMGRGGGLQSAVGTIVSTDKMEAVLTAVTRAVSATTAQIQASQASATNLPLDQKLLSATLIDVRRLEKEMEVVAQVQVDSMAGASALGALTL